MHQVLVAALSLASAALLSSGAVAQVELNASHPRTYQVQGGDTLWDIASRFLRDPWRWSELWDANRQVADPDRIYPGEVLELDHSDGRPRLRRRGGMRTVRLSPRVRVTQLQEPVPTIPVGAIRPFLTRPYVLDQLQIDEAPYIVAFPDEHIVAGAGDRIYVRSIRGAPSERYDILRPGEVLRDPDSGDVLGHKALFVGEAVLERAGDPAKLRIASMQREASLGDRLLPAERNRPQTSFFPAPGPRGSKGSIISVLDGVSQIGQYNVVVLDIGSLEGVRPGHVFEVFNGGERARDLGRHDEFRRDWAGQRFWSEDTWYAPYRSDGWMPEGEPGPDFPLHAKVDRRAATLVLPYERAGMLMIFRAFERVSFGLIMSATRPISLLDAVRPPPA